MVLHLALLVAASAVLTGLGEASLVLDQEAASSTATAGRSVSVQLEKRSLRPMGLSLTQRGSADADTSEMHKQAYFGKIKLGDKEDQEFSVVYDTGSANLIVPQTNCDSTACLEHDRYNPAQSKASKKVNCDGTRPKNSKDADGVKISFGTGHIVGECFEDVTCVGDACSKGMFIASKEETDRPFASFQFDGVLGLSLPVMAQGRQFSLLQRLVDDKSLKKPIFSVFLSDADDEPSEVTFGEVKEGHLASKISWAPISRMDTGYWEVQMKDITVGNTPQNLCTDCRVAVDTGTSQLAGPSDLMDKLSKKLNVQEDCSNFKKLPNVGFIVGKHILNLEPKDYVDKSEDEFSCSLALMKLDVPPPKGPLFIFGIPFLQKYLTAYDLPNKKVGFAVAKHASLLQEEAKALLVEVEDENEPMDADGVILETTHHEQRHRHRRHKGHHGQRDSSHHKRERRDGHHNFRSHQRRRRRSHTLDVASE